MYSARAQSAFAGPKGLLPQDVGFIFTKSLQSGTGELVQYDTRTDSVLGRMLEPNMSAAPELLMTSSGHLLFTLGGRIARDGKSLTQTLSIVESLTGATEASISVPERIQYIGPGPGTMALSSDDSLIYVYSWKPLGAGYARYWLTPVHVASHSVLPRRVALSGCGPAYFATAKRWVVVLCTSANDLRFVDPRAFKVVAKVPLPNSATYAVAAMTMPRSQDRIYIVTIDLQVIVVDTTKHRVLRVDRAYRQQPFTVANLYSAAITSDDRELVVGSMSQPHDTSSPLVLRAFYLPSLKLARTVKLARFEHLAAAPGGGLYTFPMGDSSDTDWRVQLLNSDFSASNSSIPLHGPVFQLVVPRNSSTNHA
jgi:hypothetical protein